MQHPRSECAAAAEAAGMVVQGGVTKKLDLLVIADPDSQSGKANKARRYGTRIVAESTFWTIIDHAH
jgi:DNA polymerase-3 subunit epsilon